MIKYSSKSISHKVGLPAWTVKHQVYIFIKLWLLWLNPKRIFCNQYLFVPIYNIGRYTCPILPQELYEYLNCQILLIWWFGLKSERSLRKFEICVFSLLQLEVKLHYLAVQGLQLFQLQLIITSDIEVSCACYGIKCKN